MHALNDTVDPANGDTFAPEDTTSSAGQTISAPSRKSPSSVAKKSKPSKKSAKAKNRAAANVTRKPAVAKKKTAKPKSTKTATKSKRKSPKQEGRGRSPKGIQKKLYAVLFKSLPKTLLTKDGKGIEFKELIAACKMTPEGVYRWFRKDKLMPDKAMLLVKICKGKLKLEQLYQFVFKV